MVNAAQASRLVGVRIGAPYNPKKQSDLANGEKIPRLFDIASKVLLSTHSELDLSE